MHIFSGVWASLIEPVSCKYASAVLADIETMLDNFQ